LPNGDRHHESFEILGKVFGDLDNLSTLGLSSKLLFKVDNPWPVISYFFESTFICSFSFGRGCLSFGLWILGNCLNRLFTLNLD